jgi:hypothetical protein
VAGEKLRPILIRDGSDGVIICWYDRRNGSDYDIYAQRLGGGIGNPLWTTDGVVLCGAAGDQERAFSTPDGSGGAIVTWYDARNGDWDIYAQRIDSAGNILWTGDGVPVCQTTGDQEWARIVSDGSGGAIIAWHDSREVDCDIYAQRVDPSGNSLWNVNGVLICGTWDDQTNVQLVGDGTGGAIIAWDDNRNGDRDIYVQKIDGTGSALWTGDGVPVCTALNDQTYPGICSDGSGGAIIVWRDYRDPLWGADVFVQKIDTGGTVQWDLDGVALCRDEGNQVNIHIISDGDGGAMCAWRDGEVASDIEAQRILSNGSLYYVTQSIGVTRRSQTQTLGHLAPDGTGGAIIVWYDYGADEYDIYAYRVSFDRTQIPPKNLTAEDVSNDQGGWIRLQWNKSDGDTTPNKAVYRYSVWHWRPLPETKYERIAFLNNMPYRLSHGANPGYGLGTADSIDCDSGAFYLDSPGTSYAWRCVHNVYADGSATYSVIVESLYDSMGSETRWQYFIVTADTYDQAIFYESVVDSAYSIDNVPPHQPRNFTAAIYVRPDVLQLTWKPNVDIDIDHYRLYRNIGEDFIPSEETLIAETADTSYYDDGYITGELFYYRLSACDINGNEGASAVTSYQLQARDVGDPKKEFQQQTSYAGAPDIPLTLYQNHPNPFNPTTIIQFHLPEAGRAELDIFDVSGRHVIPLTDEVLPAGFHTVTWNGLERSGTSVASGVYFYRLRFDGTELTRRMILLR